MVRFWPSPFLVFFFLFFFLVCLSWPWPILITHTYIVTVLITHRSLHWLCRISDQYAFLCFHSYPYLLYIIPTCSTSFLSYFCHPYTDYSSFCKVFLLLVSYLFFCKGTIIARNFREILIFPPEEIFRVFYFRVLGVGREIRENLDLAKFPAIRYS